MGKTTAEILRDLKGALHLRPAGRGELPLPAKAAKGVGRQNYSAPSSRLTMVLPAWSEMSCQSAMSRLHWTVYFCVYQGLKGLLRPWVAMPAIRLSTVKSTWKGRGGSKCSKRPWVRSSDVIDTALDGARPGQARPSRA